MENLTVFILDNGKLVYGNAETLVFVPNPAFTLVRNPDGGKLIVSTNPEDEVVLMLVEIQNVLDLKDENQLLIWLCQNYVINTQHSTGKSFDVLGSDIQDVQIALNTLQKKLGI
jgi:hypothetical protein